MREPLLTTRFRSARARVFAAAALAVTLVATALFLLHAVDPGLARIDGSRNGQFCFGYRQPLFDPPIPARVASPTIASATGGLRTSDGGAHWHDVSPSALRSDAPTTYARRFAYPPGFADFHLDAHHGWEARTFSSGSTCFDHAVVFTTSDAGRTWRESAPIALSIAPGLDAATQLEFIDPLHGWLWIATGPLIRPDIPVEHTDGDLYATSDGGGHWHLVSAKALSHLRIKEVSNCSPLLDDISFESLLTAWIAIGCQTGSQLELLVSRDGGVTWMRQQLPASVMNLNCPCNIQRFVTIDSSHAVMTVSGQGTDLSPMSTLLSTSDAGATWRALPATPTTGYSITMAFLDAESWWDVVTAPGWSKGLVARDWLYRTTDGGGTWTLVERGLPLGWPVDVLVFVDSHHGWAFQTEGATGSPPFGQGREVLTTADGGHTWRSVVAQVIL